MVNTRSIDTLESEIVRARPCLAILPICFDSGDRSNWATASPSTKAVVMITTSTLNDNRAVPTLPLSTCLTEPRTFNCYCVFMNRITNPSSAHRQQRKCGENKLGCKKKKACDARTFSRRLKGTCSSALKARAGQSGWRPWSSSQRTQVAGWEENAAIWRKNKRILTKEKPKGTTNP